MQCNKDQSIFQTTIYFILFFTLPLFAQQNDKKIEEYGYLKLTTNIVRDSFYVQIDNNFENCKKIIEGDIIKLPVGTHKITAISYKHPDAAFYTNIKSGMTSHHRITFFNYYNNNKACGLSSYFRIVYGYNVMIYTDEESDIIIDGKKIDQGFAQIDLSNGKHTIETRHAESGSSIKSIEIDSKRLCIYRMYNKPLKSKSQLLSILPGISQVYKGEKLKGSLILGTSLTCLISAVIYNNTYRNKNNKYLNSMEQYENAESISQAFILGNYAQDYYDKANDAAQKRDILLFC
ncbi:MAG: hypothetical protein P8X42_00765, partial [Calditrichaceae bacterium]